MKELVEIRVELDRRITEIKTLGKSRESALALTTAQQGRMLLGSVLQLLGSVTPYPQADNPASAEVKPAADVAVEYVPELPDDPIAAVKTVRAALETSLVALRALRDSVWPRDHGAFDAVVFDRALLELLVAKSWLGAELARLAPKVKKTKPAADEGADGAPGMDAVAARAKWVAEVLTLLAEKSPEKSPTGSLPEWAEAIAVRRFDGPGGQPFSPADAVAAELA